MCQPYTESATVLSDKTILLPFYIEIVIDNTLTEACVWHLL